MKVLAPKRTVVSGEWWYYMMGKLVVLLVEIA
jgi:hypothetical protein